MNFARNAVWGFANVPFLIVSMMNHMDFHIPTHVSDFISHNNCAIASIDLFNTNATFAGRCVSDYAHTECQRIWRVKTVNAKVKCINYLRTLGQMGGKNREIFTAFHIHRWLECKNIARGVRLCVAQDPVPIFSFFPHPTTERILSFGLHPNHTQLRLLRLIKKPKNSQLNRESRTLFRVIKNSKRAKHWQQLSYVRCLCFCYVWKYDVSRIPMDFIFSTTNQYTCTPSTAAHTRELCSAMRVCVLHTNSKQWHSCSRYFISNVNAEKRRT